MEHMIHVFISQSVLYFLSYIYTAVWVENTMSGIFLQVQKFCVEITSQESKTK